MPLSERYKRPTAYDDKIYDWHLGRVPKTITLEGNTLQNPARFGAIFVVHGMGEQDWAETAAHLRSGFEDALEKIHEESEKQQHHVVAQAEETPAPFIAEGYWANYDDLPETFPEDAKVLDGTKLKFFSALWTQRSISGMRAYLWFIGQQFRLLAFRTITESGVLAWLLYMPLQIVSLFSLSLVYLYKPKILARVLGDVRLYTFPRGIIERAIVQRIDRRVGAQFLRLLGIDWDFRELPRSEKIKRNGQPIEFERVIWIAHSLGSVISYNVLSDLFHHAADLQRDGDEEQKRNVARFRTSLRRFITLGSPLDKFSFLWGKQVLRPMPAGRSELLEGGEDVPVATGAKRREWWINFYHVLDPVSGALSSPLMCGTDGPVNFHIGWFKIPGIAHVAYWKDKGTLQFILSRVYGKEILPLDPKKSDSASRLTLYAFAGYLTWAAMIVSISAMLYVYAKPILWLVAFTFFVRWVWNKFSSSTGK